MTSISSSNFAVSFVGPPQGKRRQQTVVGGKVFKSGGGGSGSGMDKWHGHIAGEHRHHLGGMANYKGSTTIFASAVL